MAEFSKLCQTVSRLIDLSTNLETNPKPEKVGAVFRYMPNNRIIMGFEDSHVQTIGSIPQDRAHLYSAFSNEKAHRLFAAWLRSFGGGDPSEILSSWQTRDFDNMKYGGAILVNSKYSKDPNLRSCDIMSLSGLAEPTDEAVMIVTGLEHKMYDEAHAQKIVAVSKNPVYSELYQKAFAN